MCHSVFYGCSRAGVAVGVVLLNQSCINYRFFLTDHSQKGIHKIFDHGICQNHDALSCLAAHWIVFAFSSDLDCGPLRPFFDFLLILGAAKMFLECAMLC